MTTINEFRGAALESTCLLPNGRAIAESGYVLAGFGRSRDSHTIEESNFWTAYKALQMVAGEGDQGEVTLHRPWEDDDPCTAAVAIARWRHWAVGWVEEIMVRADTEAVLAVAAALQQRVEDYPILDEDDVAQRDAEEGDTCDECGDWCENGSGRYREDGARVCAECAEEQVQ